MKRHGKPVEKRRRDRIPVVEVIVARRPGSPITKTPRSHGEPRAPQKGRFDEWIRS